MDTWRSDFPASSGCQIGILFQTGLPRRLAILLERPQSNALFLVHPHLGHPQRFPLFLTRVIVNLHDWYAFNILLIHAASSTLAR